MENSSFYDLAINLIEKGALREARKELILKATGRVLEVGAGTGINFPFYRGVEQVDAIEPNPSAIKKSHVYKKAASVPIMTHVQGAEHLSFTDHTFDTVVGTLVFCTIPNPVKALAEIRRVTKPNGKILLFEHVKMDNPFLGQMQELVNPVWKRLFSGCHLNRNTLQTVKEAGFKVKNVTPYYKGLFIVMECTVD